MRRATARFLAAGLTAVLLAGLAGAPPRAGFAPPGGFVKGKPHPFMPEPPGRYRTDLGWLIASMVTNENLWFWQRSLVLQAGARDYQAAIRSEMAHYAGLKGMDYYSYTDGLIRDLARIQILSLENDQLTLALGTVPVAVLADLASMSIVSGIKHVLPPARQGVLALDSRFLQPGTEQHVMARYAFIDMEQRYQELMGSAVMEEIRLRAAGKVTAAEIRDLLSESVISAAIGSAVDAVRGSPEHTMDLMRRQKVMDLAGFGCACVLDCRTNRPPAAHVAALGPTDDYRTGLAYLLSVKLTPPGTNVLNALTGRAADQLLAMELADIKRMREDTKHPLRYDTYMRSLLVDLETLERAQIDALNGGMAAAFIENTVVNALFGALAVGGGPGAQIAAILANAGYGALGTYATLSEEARIRLAMAMFRELVMDLIRPRAGQCGCGAGVAVVPARVIQGKPDGGR